MKYTYEIQDTGNIKRTDKSGQVAWIPPDINNVDYAEYVASLAIDD